MIPAAKDVVQQAIVAPATVEWSARAIADLFTGAFPGSSSHQSTRAHHARTHESP